MTEGDFLESWPLDGGPPLRRFARFFEALAARSDAAPAWAEQSLGACNRQLARMHRQLVGRPVEAVVSCGCGEDLEVVLPLEAIAAAPDPAPQIEIAAPGPRQFRLPRLSEIALAGRPQDLASRCAVDDGGPVPEAYVDALDAAWAQADSAAEIALDLTCPSCGAAVRARADLALFVARDFDLRVQGLMAEIHGLACAYGWTEAEVLAVPPARRRAYAALIAGARDELS